MDYAGRDSHTGEQSQHQHAYETSALQHTHPQHQQHRASLHHPGAPATGLSEAPDPHHSNPHTQHQHQHQHQAMPQHHQHHTPQLMMDPSQMGHHRMAPQHFATPGQVVNPMYQTMSTTPTQPQHTPHHHTRGTKRPRPDDLDLSVAGMPDLDHTDLESMQTPMGTAYAQAAAVAAAASQAPPTHHHHRLPDAGPPSKMMRREDGGGGAPSVVGQVGMPPPAPRPRGPKLKFTPEDDQLLIDLKEHKNLTWKQIADFFPGRSSGTLQVRYCTKLKAKTTQWTDETVRPEI